MKVNSKRSALLVWKVNSNSRLDFDFHGFPLLLGYSFGRSGRTNQGTFPLLVLFVAFVCSRYALRLLLLLLLAETRFCCGPSSRSLSISTQRTHDHHRPPWLTQHFMILTPWNSSINEFYIFKNCWLTSFETLQLWKVQSGVLLFVERQSK